MTEISLHGFNNLTKSLSFSLYKLHYLSKKQDHRAYNAHINTLFCANNLNSLLTKICHAIGGNVLNVAKQDYQPQGASVTLMISEEAQPESLVAHLDKSHLCIHTYPEEAPQEGLAIFRADIELSTCGVISPLKILDYVINEFGADVINIDYRIRGMTRDKQGRKLFNDDNITNISDHISTKLTADFHIEDHSLATHNIFHTKLLKKNRLLNSYLFECKNNDFTTSEQNIIQTRIEQELHGLFTNSP